MWIKKTLLASLLVVALAAGAGAQPHWGRWGWRGRDCGGWRSWRDEGSRHSASGQTGNQPWQNPVHRWTPPPRSMELPEEVQATMDHQAKLWIDFWAALRAPQVDSAAVLELHSQIQQDQDQIDDWFLEQRINGASQANQGPSQDPGEQGGFAGPSRQQGFQGSSQGSRDEGQGFRIQDSPFPVNDDIRLKAAELRKATIDLNTALELEARDTDRIWEIQRQRNALRMELSTAVLTSFLESLTAQE